MRFLVLALVMALLPSLAHAQWSKNGQPVPDVPNQKSRDGFGAQLLVITHFPEFIKEWTTSPPEHVPHIPAVSKSKRGEALAIVLCFGGCKADTSGHCNAVYDLTIVRPDGSTMHSFPDLELWKQEAPPYLQLGSAVPQVKFDRTDPAGRYHIRAVVRDKNRHVELQLETTLDVK